MKLMLFSSVLLLTTRIWAADSLPYRLTGMELEEEWSTDVEKAIATFQPKMLTFIGDNSFPAKRVDLEIHINKDYDVYRTGMIGGWNKGKFTGVINIAHPNRYDGKRRSTWGVPFDRNYFLRIILHEIAPIYLERAAKLNGATFYGKPSWIVQGAEEFFSFHYGFEGGGDPAKNVLRKSDLSNLEYGLVLSNPYIDGYLLFRFVYEMYGTKAALQLFISRRTTTAGILKDATKEKPTVFLKDLAAYLKNLGIENGPQQHSAPDTSGAGDL